MEIELVLYYPSNVGFKEETRRLPIPPFIYKAPSPYELLPEGVHDCDEAEFRAFFVIKFSNSPNRRQLWDGFIRLRNEAVALGISGVQWIDGSFVVRIDTPKHPEHIDVVTFCDYSWYNQWHDAPVKSQAARKRETRVGSCTETPVLPATG